MLTRRELIIKWTFFGGAALALAFLCDLFLHDVRILGVRLFLPPLLVGAVASMEDTRAGVAFAIVCGVLCDITVPGTFPCVYTLAFPAAALCCSLMAISVLQPGPVCSLAASALTFLFVDALNMLALFIRHRAPLAPMLDLALRETLASCVLLVIVHPGTRWLHRRFTI